jgi:hypothetical protein
MFPSQPANCGGASHNRNDCGICGPRPRLSIPSPLDPTSPLHFAQPNFPYGKHAPPKTQPNHQAKPRSGYAQGNSQSTSGKSESFDGWMAKFCVEPEDGYDAGGCCLAFWIPCAQYGKTHWRLKQVEDGKDPSNAKWKSSDGCNGPCWAWYGLCCLLQCDCEFSSVISAKTALFQINRFWLTHLRSHRHSDWPPTHAHQGYLWYQRKHWQRSHVIALLSSLHYDANGS